MALPEFVSCPVDYRGASIHRQSSVATIEREPLGSVVWLEGEHDAFTVAALSQVIDGALAIDTGDLILDLSRVQFLAVRSVGVIIRTREVLRSQSRSLVLRSPSSSARRVLDLLDLGDLVGLRASDGEPDAGPQTDGPPIRAADGVRRLGP
jgi:anti-anti-sigma factor